MKYRKPWFSFFMISKWKFQNETLKTGEKSFKELFDGSHFIYSSPGHKCVQVLIVTLSYLVWDRLKKKKLKALINQEKFLSSFTEN